MARRYDSQASKKRILSACVRLFIQKGYNNTTVAEILSESNTANSTFQNIFRSKDGVLLDLTEYMFKTQFAAAKNNGIENLKPIYLYAVETSIQLTLTELNENLRDVYVEAYTNERTAEFIRSNTTVEFYKIFSEYNPGYSQSDFYEIEIGTSGIMRNYMSRHCDKYFILEKKVERFLSMTFKAYNVPDDEAEEIISFIRKTDMLKSANQLMQKLFEELALRFDFELTQ